MLNYFSFTSHEKLTRKQNPQCPPPAGALVLVITLPLPITLAVLRPAWGSLQLFRAIKLNKMEPRCDHRAHSDHSVPSVPCPWFCSTLAPGLATAQLMTNTIYIHQHFIGHRNCSILIVDELELCFCGSTCFKLYIIHSYIWGKKYNI